MVSSTPTTRTRKRPEERREEILDAAAAIALDEGLERITLRAVAERLAVRPGLITHYFPVADDLVVAAFARATAEERERLFAAEGSPLDRMRRLVADMSGPGALRLSRLWLNARHLSRFQPALASTVEEQEELDRMRLQRLVEEGAAAGAFVTDDPLAACVRILVAVDGVGAYANDASEFAHEAYAHFLSDVAEWSLGLPPGALRTP